MATGDGQAGELADGREVVRLHEVHGRERRVQRAVLAADRQVALGEIQVPHLASAARRRTESDAAGVGEEVEHRLAGTVGLHPATGVAQVEEEQRVLAGVAATYPVVQAPFVAHQILQSGGLGLVDRVAAVDPGIALGAVVVDQQQLFAEECVHRSGQLQQGLALHWLVEALHHQLRTVAVDGQARDAFLAAVEEPVAIGALGMEFGQQRLAGVEGGAQRLEESGGHARRLTEKGAQFNKGRGRRGPGRPHPCSTGRQPHASACTMHGTVAHGPAQ
ncbi:hypothetical protein D9M68_550540 [compost metagenome]